MRLFVLFIFVFSIAGCTTFNKNLKAFLNGGEETQKAVNPNSAPNAQDQLVKFSDTPNTPIGQERQYQRMTKKQFEEQELFSDNAGSLWEMEGQDSYLFSQNIVRLPGDILNVQLDGQPEKQLSTKAQVIKELTARIEKARAQRDVASAKDAAASGAAGGDKKEGADKKEGGEKQAAAAAAKPEEGKEAEGSGTFDVKTIPSRIVERMSDGTYRVKGAQTFMIGSKEYKVIVTGLVKPSDIAEDSVASSKMMDSRFDIVRYNTKGKNL
jgi:flagellar L-ring protein precursor FlgH